MNPSRPGPTPENPYCMRCGEHLGMPFHETNEHDAAADTKKGPTR